MPEPLVSSVVVHTEGAHEAVNVWLRGAHVGKLLVGQGQGEPLRSLLLAPEPSILRPTSGLGSHAADLAELRIVQAENEKLEATLADVAKGSTHELVRWLLEKLIAAEKQFETARDAFAERCGELKSQLGSKHKAMVRAVTEADKSSATIERVRKALSTSFEYGDRIDAIREALDVEVRIATDEEQREALDRAAKQPDPYLAPELWTDEQRATIPRVVPEPTRKGGD